MSKVYDPSIEPYDNINFVTRHAVIYNKENQPLFDKIVVFPDYFSDNAVNIVASKYFYNSNDDKKAEVDIRSMINRVSHTLGDWGLRQNYFNDEFESKTFVDKLKYYQIHQMFCFNSPVYFNMGINNKVQASACFILEVDDNMESITNVMCVESKIFKKGSGSGMNLSNIRSKFESINNEKGNASGPVSFLKVHDLQGSVIKCITDDTYLFTNHGLLQIKDLLDSKENYEEGFYDITNDKLQLLNYKNELEGVSQLYCGKEEDIYKIKLKSTGLELRGTQEHPILILTEDFKLEWKKLSEVEIGDYTFVNRKMESWSTTYPNFNNFVPDLKVARRKVIYPKTISKELARLLGYLVADGYIDGYRRRICYGKNDINTVNDFCDCFEKVFNQDIKNNFSSRHQNNHEALTHSVKLEWYGLFSFFNFIGLEANRSNKKEIPWCILQSPKEIVVEFLKAYFESDSGLYQGSILNSGSVSEKLAKQLQQLLLNLGIIASRKDVIRDGRPYFQLHMLGKETDNFMENIGFLTKEKNSLYIKKDKRHTNIDSIPYLISNLRKKMLVYGGSYVCKDGKQRRIKLDIFESHGSNISVNRILEKDILTKIEIIDQELYDNLKFILDSNVFLDKIKIIEQTDIKERVYDFTLPETHTFIANGIVNHNSGGSLRRSAKIAVLNADHPDIEDFIDCKKYEEEKLNILRNAGIKPQSGKELSDEVFYQSTNLSVGISNDFMDSVIKDLDWNTKFVTNPRHVHKSYKARDLLYKIAERAWEMGDPGLQFLDTVNDWNTVLNDGRIVSSNPCLPIWAPVLTSNGYKKLGDLKNSIYLNGEKTCSDVFKTGNKEVHEVYLENGMCLYATGNHKVTTNFGDVEVKDLEWNKHKVKISINNIDFKLDKDEFSRGYNSESKDILFESLSFQKGYIDKLFLNNDYITDESCIFLRQVQLILSCFNKYSKIKDYNVLTIVKEVEEYSNVTYSMVYSKEDVYDINVPDGNHFISGGCVISNCGEFYFLNNSSCNLAALNLIKFFNKTDSGYEFDFELFKDVIETAITAQDIIVDGAIYPTEEITNNSSKYRPLGLGFTNLGSLLMYLGFPYDSDEGRHLASSLTSLMTGIGYLCSNGLSNKLGSFEYFDRNKESFYSIMNKHYDSLENRKSRFKNNKFPIIGDLYNLAAEIWNSIKNKVINKETFRNAQVSLLAPTGTTSMLLDAQTTGIEPEFSHVKYKRLSNTDGGVIKFTSDVVKTCLDNLGYKDKEINEIECFIKDDKPLDLCRCLQKEHVKIFDTSNSIISDQIIGYEGHINMLAAVQPFLSGGISKSVAFPNNCTIEDIFKCYVECWKLGLKGVTAYRDGSKIDQPLSNKKSDEEIDEEIYISDGKVKNDRLIKYMHSILAKRSLPDEVPSITHKFNINQFKGYITCGMYEDDGDLGQLFINISKEGSTLSGLLDCLAIVTSISLQRGVPLKDIVEKMISQSFEPAGITSNKQIRITTSIVDYIFKYLGIKFLSKEDQLELGLIHEEQQEQMFETATENIIQNTFEKNVRNNFVSSGKVCSRCGGYMVRKGTCDFCLNCAETGGCG